ncbi:MAG: hypothetical protein JSR99_01115 [Proteobacteria bacterium]|nr:hypothetical protein [Pseudomonadota bacterium]
MSSLSLSIEIELFFEGIGEEPNDCIMDWHDDGEVLLPICYSARMTSITIQRLCLDRMLPNV